MSSTTSPATPLSEVVSENSLHMLTVWLKSHPLKSNVLSRGDLKIAAANILLRKKEHGATRIGKSPKLAAILLVLYVQEGLIHGGDKILSLSMPEIFEMLRDEVRARAITREQLRSEVEALDGLEQMQEMAIAQLPASFFPGAGAASSSIGQTREGHDGMRDRHGSLVSPGSPRLDEWLKPLLTTIKDLRTAAPDPPSFESARLHERVGPWPDSMRSIVREHLGLRHLYARVTLALVACSWFVVADHFDLWRFFGTDPFARHRARVGYFFLVMMGASLVIAGSYPNDLHSPAGRKLILPALSVCVVCAVTAGWRGINDARYPNDACRVVHMALWLFLLTNWWRAWILCWQGKATWAVVRSVLFLDGIGFTVANIVIRSLGPLPFYLPRNSTFEIAMIRAGTTLCISALLSPGNRHRIAAAFHASGWNHITVGLTELTSAEAAAGASPRSPAVATDDAAQSSGRGTRAVASQLPRQDDNDEWIRAGGRGGAGENESVASSANSSEVAFQLCRDVRDATVRGAALASMDRPSNVPPAGATAMGGGTASNAAFESWYEAQMSAVVVATICVCIAGMSTALSDDATQKGLFLASGATCLMLVIARRWDAQPETASVGGADGVVGAGVAVAAHGETPDSHNAPRSAAAATPLGGGSTTTRGGLGAAVQSALVRSHCTSSPVSIVGIIYTIATTLYSFTLPREVVSAASRYRSIHSPHSTTLGYFTIGALVALQGGPRTRVDRYLFWLFIALINIRVAQLCYADEEPFELLKLCLGTDVVPFNIGLAAVWLPGRVVRQLWVEIRQAKQLTQSANAEAAAERDRAWALEVNRREGLVKPSRKRLPRL